MLLPVYTLEGARYALRKDRIASLVKDENKQCIKHDCHDEHRKKIYIILFIVFPFHFVRFCNKRDSVS